jgi:hypothetical protein
VTRRRTVAGGGIEVEVAPDRLVGWIDRFAARNAGLRDISTDGRSVQIRAGEGTLARLTVPFGAMAVDDREPVDALLRHLATLGELGVILVRGGAHSVGIVKDGVTVRSSTDRAYLQGRTAAGGWSQQRFARRRDNQRTASLDDAATAAARLLVPEVATMAGLVLGGDRRSLADVLADPRLAPLAALPSRTFGDVPEPRRAVLDEIATRSLSVPIVIVDAAP